jgi:hypothetical protein
MQASSEQHYRLMAVVIVYDRGLEAVAAWPALAAELTRSASARARFERVLIYDNSPVSRARPPQDIPGCVYIHDQTNGGTAAGYVAAAAMAAEAGIEWLLLLDQDTLLTQSFIEGADAALKSGTSPGAAALVPRIFQGTMLISPARVNCFGTISPLRRGKRDGLDRITAISSGTILNVAMFNEVLPLPAGLWLDYVDHWIFAKLHERGHAIRILDQALQHDLSVTNVSSLSRQRLFSILNGEACFNSALGGKARLVYPLRLVARMIHYAFVKPELAWASVAWISGRRGARGD